MRELGKECELEMETTFLKIIVSFVFLCFGNFQGLRTFFHNVYCPCLLMVSADSPLLYVCLETQRLQTLLILLKIWIEDFKNA